MPWVTLRRKDGKAIKSTLLRADESTENAQFRVLQELCRGSDAYWTIEYEKDKERHGKRA